MENAKISVYVESPHHFNIFSESVCHLLQEVHRACYVKLSGVISVYNISFQLKGGRPNNIEDLAQGNRFFHVYGKREAQKLHHMKVTLEDDITTLGDQLGDHIWPQQTGNEHYTVRKRNNLTTSITLLDELPSMTTIVFSNRRQWCYAT